jgi:integrase
MSGHVVKRGKKYSIVVEMGNDETGKRKQKWYSGYRTKKEAETDLHRILHELRTGQFIDTTKLTTGQWLDRWLADYCLHLKPYTVRGYEDTVKQVKAEIGDVPLQRLTTAHIQKMVEKWHTIGTCANRGPLAALTIKKQITNLATALNKAVDLELIRKNPTTKLSLPRVPKQERSVLSEAQVKLMLAAAKATPMYMPILLAVTTGMRRAEILALRWRDYDPVAGVLLVRRNAVQVDGKVIYHDAKTASSVRAVALSPSLIEELEAHFKRQAAERSAAGDRWQDHDLICTVELGAPMKPEWLSARYLYWASTHGFSVTFHGLRHTHASLLLGRGINLKVTQERLGHSDIGMTANIYSHTNAEMQQAAVDAMEAIMGVA